VNTHKLLARPANGARLQDEEAAAPAADADTAAAPADTEAAAAPAADADAAAAVDSIVGRFITITPKYHHFTAQGTPPYANHHFKNITN
jgi:hypothetical protein